MVFPTSVNFPAMRPRFFTPWGAMSLMLRCFSARKFSLFPLPSQHENEFFFRKRCCEGMFFENSPTFCRKFATPEPSLPPFSAHPVHPWVKHAAASHTRTHTYAPTRTRLSRFSFFAFTPSPERHKRLFSRTLGVKVLRVNAFTFPSRSARLPSRHHGEEKEKTAKR